MTTRQDHSVSRRAALAGLGAGGLGLALGSVDHAVAQAASPAALADHPLVGTWVVHFEDPAEPPAVAIWGADGSFVDAANGHTGAWQATGPRSGLHTWVHVFAENANYVVVSGTIEVDASGESWTQPYSSMVVAADGTVLNTGSGKVSAKRLRPVPEAAMGTALEVVPTWTPAAATPAG